MTKTFLLTLSFMATTCFGQAPGKPLDPLLHDTTLKIVYVNTENQAQPLAYFLNGKFANQTVIKTLNPNLIDSIYIIGKDTEMNGIHYHDEIYIKTKNGYIPKLISLTDLKVKYTKPEHKTALFMIDGEFVNADSDKSLVDENYLLRIIVDHVKDVKENSDFIVIKLVTKSDANIKKVNEIYIRGAVKNMPPI